MFTAIKFRNFKSLKDYNVRLRPMNVLVGPNNAGKSTILDALRVMASAYRFASRRVQQPIRVNGNTIVGYDIPTANFPISLANIHSDYLTDQETSIVFTFENGNKLQLEFFDNARCILTIAEAKQRTSTTAQFRKNFPASIYSFPTLGPLEEDEALLNDEYVRQWQETRRAHRMFRNIWHRRPEQFAAFEQLVQQTWAGMSISKPEVNHNYPPSLSMFCTEGRVDRELCWAGFGFQVWLQILTHLIGAENDSVLVVDEPEIYLHPDLQRKLFQLLRSSRKQVVLATHSAEIVNEAEHDDVVLVNRSKKSATRVSDAEGLQDALTSIGSAQNIHLARLSRGRKILFLEGDDYRLLRRFAAQLGFEDLANDVNITVVPIGGFSQRQRIEDTAWAFEKILKAEVKIAALLDRDFRCQEEVDELVSVARTRVPYFHILGSKEIENYLLCPQAIAAAAQQRLKEKKEKTALNVEQIERLVQDVVLESKSDVLGQYVSNRVRFFNGRSAKDPSTVVKEAMINFETDWSDPDRRVQISPGKRVFASLNGRLQTLFGVSITSTQVIRHLSAEDVGADFLLAIKDFDQMARAN